jgi:hypothetical protein
MAPFDFINSRSARMSGTAGRADLDSGAAGAGEAFGGAMTADSMSKNENSRSLCQHRLLFGSSLCGRL